MPSESAAPIAVALALALAFALLSDVALRRGAVFFGIAGLGVAAWLWHEPESGR